jgi:excisionase family DNA binding protein
MNKDFLAQSEHPVGFSFGEYPLTVREAAKFLGVSPQTVYLWVERKQIPHLRVMGRNIRFLKSDLEPFRASFKQEMENGKTT